MDPLAQSMRGMIPAVYQGCKRSPQSLEREGLAVAGGGRLTSVKCRLHRFVAWSSLGLRFIYSTGGFVNANHPNSCRPFNQFGNVLDSPTLLALGVAYS